MASPSRSAWSARAAVALAAGAGAALLLGPGFARFGLLPPLGGFLLFALGLVAGTLGLLPLGVVALLRTRPSSGRAGRSSAVLATLVGVALAVALVLLAVGGRGVPPIHDVTTDPEDPPEFRAALRHPDNAGRDLSYPHGGADVPEQQRAAYPDLAPLPLPLGRDETLRLARQAAEAMGWTGITVDQQTGTVEASDTSAIFRFVDDVVVRVGERDTGSVVDVRSTSRVGQSDLGANSKRIRAFLAELRELAGPPPPA